ncbi:MAG: SlyX family protein [Myxococcota bacterium]
MESERRFVELELRLMTQQDNIEQLQRLTLEHTNSLTELTERIHHLERLLETLAHHALSEEKPPHF